jgi:predicted dehydrogenase
MSRAAAGPEDEARRRTPLRIGIVGAGVGRFHANIYAGMPDVEVVAIADRSPKRLDVPLAEFAEHHGARSFALASDLLEQTELDVLDICTPPSTHRELVDAAAARGLDVILEKPLAASLADCSAIQARCADAGIRVQVFFPMRALPVVRRLHELVSDGALGAVGLGSAQYVMGPRPAGHWVWSGSGSSPVNENTCHLVDLLRFLLGEVAGVQASVVNVLHNGGDLPDAAAATLTFERGTAVALAGGAVGTPGGRFAPQLTLWGSEGQADMRGTAHTFTELTWSRHDGTTGRCVDDRPVSAPGDLSTYAPYPLLEPGLRAVVDALLGTGEGTGTIRDGTAAVRTCLSLLTHGTPDRAGA